jgi:hypothetical protein
MVMKCSVFWHTSPSSPLKVIRSLGEIYRLYLQVSRVDEQAKQETSMKQATNVSNYYLAYSLALKTEAICCSETSANFHWTTQPYVSLAGLPVNLMKFRRELRVKMYSYPCT